MDPALHKDKPELRVLVLSIPLQVLSNRNRLFYKMIEILRNLGCKPQQRLPENKNPKNLASSHALNLCDTMGVTKDDTNL
ncbi:hypothetical protein HPP92_008838 [Vanilla planifolia]|uniref:Uncharacterized protein n=1 Tax=Vanilla planifolia TaxID=51239 RepID=A0A835R5F9_VANPL|nr:hypothetical protein HPP92_008838 [Vanilla planifolia]